MFCAMTCLDNLLLCQCGNHNQRRTASFCLEEGGGEERRKGVVTQHAQSPNSVAAMHKPNSVIEAAAVYA